MKKFLSVLIALTLLLCGLATFAVSSSAKATELLEIESEWEYIVYEESADGLTATAPDGWLDGSDDAEWTEGYAPFAGQGGNGMAVTFFDYANFSAYLRTTFTVKDLDAIKALELSVIFDENPTIYLNGEVIWTADGYLDKDYTNYDITEAALPLLKEGENTVCVEFSNVYGGSVFDAYITAYDQVTLVDDEGYVAFSGATSEGFTNFGAINAPTNVLDGDQSTVCGSGWNPDVTQAITATFKGAVKVTEVYVQCKNEGTTSHEDGMTRGSYDIYLINGDTETQINEEPVPALTIDDGGYTITLDEATEATGVKIVITDWLGTNWACLADVMVSAEQPAEPEPPVVDPTPVEPSDDPVEPSDEPSVEPSVEPSGEPSGDDNSASAEESTPAASEDEDKTSESKPTDGDKNENKSGLSTGAIIGIVVAVIAVVAIVVVVVVVLKKKKA